MGFFYTIVYQKFCFMGMYPAFFYILEAALWSLLASISYKETVLNAVNLGMDTDTTGAVAGGIAGVYYGYESIPVDYLDSIVKAELIMDLCHRFYVSLIGISKNSCSEE